jgi:hypothetical protein
MTPESWEFVQGLIARVRELDAAERERILAQEAAAHPEEVATVRRLLELEPPSQFIEPIHGAPRAERFFGGGLAGTRLGDFQLETEIGRGGMGVVYRATQVGLERTVAVKVLPLAALGGARALERFRREAKAASTLTHARIVDVLAYGETEGIAWFAMRWVDGHDLAVEIGLQAAGDEPARCLLPANDPARYLAVAVERMAELAEAVQHAHDRGIVHRDIKPQNILLDREGRMNLADFGLAKSERLGAISRTAEVQGTPHYMSPEQVRALRGGVDHRTDVYSLGVVLYEVLVRRRPFQADTPVLVMHAITSQEPRRPTKIDPALPQALETICLRAIEKRPADRYASARELADDLRRYLRGEAIVAVPPSALARLRRKLERHARALAGLSAGALVVAAAWACLAWLRERADDVLVRLELVCDIDPAGASVRVIELDPQFRTRRAARDVGAWPVDELRLETGAWRCVIDLPDYGFAEVDLDLDEGGTSLTRRVRLRPRAEVLGDMPSVPAGTVVLWHPDYTAPGDRTGRAHLRYDVAGFHLDELPVTARQYARYLEQSGRPPPGSWPASPDDAWLDKPICSLRQEDAQAYAEFHGKRLPTLAELQLAARGAAGRLFPWGDEPGTQLAQLQLGRPEIGRDPEFPDQSLEECRRWFDLHVRAVGSDPPDTVGPYGHRELFGNVMAWSSSPVVRFVEGRPLRDPGVVYVAGVPCFRSVAAAARRGLEDYLGLERLALAPFVGLRCATSAQPHALDPAPTPTESARVDSR